MTFFQLLRLACFSAAASAMLPATADSFVSSASSAGSTSSGSVSDSLQGSSNSSDGHDKKVADGDYRILDMAPTPGRSGIASLTLEATGTPQRVVLNLPQKVVDQRGLQPGSVVHAQNRAYGIEFASVDTREAFYLVLADAWYDELASRPVTL